MDHRSPLYFFNVERIIYLYLCFLVDFQWLIIFNASCIDLHCFLLLFSLCLPYHFLDMGNNYLNSWFFSKLLCALADWSEVACLWYLWSILECLWQVRINLTVLRYVCADHLVRVIRHGIFGFQELQCLTWAIIPPCHQQAFGPSCTRISFAAKECASFILCL